MSDSRKRAMAKYRKKCRQFVMTFYPCETELIEYFEHQENKTKYLKDLIRKDMEKQDIEME